MRLRFSRFFMALLMVGVLLVGGCSTPPAASSTSETSIAKSKATEASSKTTQATSEPTTTSESVPGMSNLPKLAGKATVEMTVNGGKIEIEVDGTNAPITGGNFVDLVNKGVYNGLMFHRVIKSPQPFVAQGGDPQSKDPNVPVSRLGTGSYVDDKTGKIRYIPLEIKPKGAAEPIYSKTFEQARITQVPELQHKQGAIAMARSQAPDSASSQFYFALAELDFLDGNYAVFGYVTKGFDVVNKIQQGDRIESATVIKGLENLKVDQ
ncbi:MAG TPA: peptidylprolyl isomerase [Nostocaceae cyanobacterium]|nr:peptidylprolyl isomerase [Nostocaceae cyanobacterium]